MGWDQACLLLSSWQFGEVWGPKPDLNLYWSFWSRFEGIFFLVRSPPSLKFAGKDSIGSPKWPYLSPLACLPGPLRSLWSSSHRMPCSSFGHRCNQEAREQGLFQSVLVGESWLEFTPGSFYERFLMSNSAWDKHARIESHRVLRPLSRQLIYIYIYTYIYIWLGRYDGRSIEVPKCYTLKIT